MVALNEFTENQVINFLGLTNATFLNGLKAAVVSATATQFVD